MKTIKKIGIMGAHGCGKSTIAFGMAMGLAGMDGHRAVLVHEQARECPYPVNQRMTLKSQRWLFGRQIVAEAQAAKSAQVMICDRTILDPLVYATWMMERGHHEFAAFLGHAMPYALRHLDTYTKLIWCRPQHMEVAFDGFRDTDPVFRLEIDAIFARFVAGYKLLVEAPEQVYAQVKCAS